MTTPKGKNCLECHRLSNCGGDLYYCPYAWKNPCIYGHHYILEKPKPVEETVKQIVIPKKKIPEFKPPIILKQNAIDWEPYHNMIFELLYKGMRLSAIAERVGVRPSALRSYLERYGRR